MTSMPDDGASGETPDPEVAEPAAPDSVLLESRDLARDALGEITDPQTIGSDDGYEVHEDHVVTLFFECRLPGYPGWRWAATLARVDTDSPVNVLETELLPGAGSVVAPEWVPWSVRLAQYREAQAKQAADEAVEAAEAEAEAEASAERADGDLDIDDLDDGDELDGSEDIEDGDDIDDGDDIEVDEDGFADLDEHDLHDDDDDDVVEGLEEGSDDDDAADDDE